MTTKLGIAIDLDVLRGLMKEYLSSHGDLVTELDDWRFERFLQWLQRRQQQRQLMKEGEGDGTKSNNTTD